MYLKVGIGACLLAALWAADTAGPAANGHWPQWRGPFDNGVARTSAPVEFSKDNLKWKVAIPGRGHSTPVIWGDRIFLTTAVQIGQKPEAPKPEGPPAGGPGGRRGPGGPGGGPQSDTGPQAEHRFDVMCIDRRTGKVLWQRTALTATPHEGYHMRYGSFASNSPVTDGERVYATFGSRGIFVYDLDGKPLWQKDPGVKLKMRLTFGEGMAPVLHDDRLIVVYDHEGSSFIVALDKKTGKQLWRTEREEMTGWSAPLVVEHEGKKQIVTSATKKVRAYDFKSGELIWECTGIGLNPIPVPVYEKGVVYVMSGYRDPNLLAIKLGRTGDLTGTDAIIWKNDRGNSYTASPILHDGKLFLLTDNGMVSLLNAANGEAFFRQVRLPKSYNFKASPVLAGDKVYLAAEDGDVIVLKWGEKLDVVATNSFPDEFFVASPVVAGGEIYLRGTNTLYCLK